jgi:hypothetical protein
LRLVALAANPRFPDFCTGRYYFPDSGRDQNNTDQHNIGKKRAEGAMPEAFDFILNMDERLQAAGFLQWSHLLEGNEYEHEENKLQGTQAPFTREDRLQIDSMLGTIIASGNEPTDDDVEMVIQSLPGPQIDEEGKPLKRIERARTHIEKVLNEPSYRAELVRTKLSPHEIIKAIKHEEPKSPEAYTNEELSVFISGTPNFAPIEDDAINHLSDPTFRFVIANQKHEHDVRFYRPVPTLLQLQKADGKPGLITDISATLAANLLGRGVVERPQIAAIYKAVNIACGIVFGMEEDGIARNGSRLDQPGYHHVLCLPRTQARIKDLASALLTKWHCIRHIDALYSDVIDD